MVLMVIDIRQPRNSDCNDITPEEPIGNLFLSSLFNASSLSMYEYYLLHKQISTEIYSNSTSESNCQSLCPSISSTLYFSSFQKDMS